MKQWFRQFGRVNAESERNYLTKIERSGEKEEEHEFGKLLE